MNTCLDIPVKLMKISLNIFAISLTLNYEYVFMQWNHVHCSHRSTDI